VTSSTRKGTELRRAGDFIQPDYVERIVGELDTISEVCVYGIPAASGAPGESDLVAAVTPLNADTINPEIVFDKCKKDLEPNFIPSYIQVVDEIPKTISEKPLDRVLRDAFAPENENIYAYEDYR